MDNQDYAEKLALEMTKRKTNHILHLLLSVITAGLWIIVWICISYNNAQFNKQLGKPPRSTYDRLVLFFIIVVVVAVVSKMEGI